MRGITPARIAGGVTNRALSALNPLLDRIECRNRGDDAEPLPFRPVFIIGAPRSGSTLLYQLLLQSFDFAYFSNLHCRFWGGPSIIERRLKICRRRPPERFDSKHGVVAGWRSPSECGEFWYRFFRRLPQFVPAAEADAEKMQRLRRAIRAYCDAAGRPVLLKNMHCALRLGALFSTLPEARYIYIRRDLVENAHSLLETRMSRLGSYEDWWSMEPPEIEDLRRLPAHQQVVGQVRGINQLVENARANDPGSFCTVEYNELREDPASVVDGIGEFLSVSGANVDRLAWRPAPFESPWRLRIDPELYDRLVDEARSECESRHGRTVLECGSAPGVRRERGSDELRAVS